LEESLRSKDSKSKIIDLARTKRDTTSAKGSIFAGSSAPTSDWRTQLNLKLDRLKEETDSKPLTDSAGSLLREIQHREFTRPSRARADSVQNELFLQSSADYHPLALKTLEKLKRVSHSQQVEEPSSLPAPTSEPLQPRESSVASRVQAAKPKKTAASRSDKIERIEINLSQADLPFGETESGNAGLLKEGIKKGLTPAALSLRIRAGAIDGLFLVGCLLIFLMIVFFVPDFVFLSRSSFAGLTAVAAIFASGYLFLLTALSGRTLGMEREHLQVITFDGRLPSLREVSLRCFGSFISMGCFCLGFLWAFFDPQKLTWHDRISKTLIVSRKPHA
jgi:uncharacterized RDD family membrane protein YckC